MANRRYDKPWTLGERRILIEGSFVPLTGAGTVVASTVRGFGFGYAPVNGVMALAANASPGITGTPGIVRTSTGLYTVTMEDSYLDLDSLLVSWNMPATGYGAAAPTVHGVTSPSIGVAGAASSFQIVIVTVSTGAVVDAAASMKIAFQAAFRDSTNRFAKP